VTALSVVISSRHFSPWRLWGFVIDAAIIWLARRFLAWRALASS